MTIYYKRPLFQIPNVNLMPVILNNLLSFTNLAKMILILELHLILNDLFHRILRKCKFLDVKTVKNQVLQTVW